MTRDEAEKIAKRFDFGDNGLCCLRAVAGICYEHNAIAEALLDADAAAREEAAKVAESYYGSEPDRAYNHQLKKAGTNIATAIRARSAPATT